MFPRSYVPGVLYSQYATFQGPMSPGFIVPGSYVSRALHFQHSMFPESYLVVFNSIFWLIVSCHLNDWEIPEKI